VSDDRADRIVVIVPQQRMLRWHDDLVQALRRSFPVDVCLLNSVSAYPAAFRAWLKIESWLFADDDLTTFKFRSSKSWNDFESDKYSFIVNLSEHLLASSAIPIIEPRFNGSRDSMDLVSILLSGRNPYLSFHLVGERKVITASYPAIQDKAILNRALRSSFSRLAALAERSVHSVLRGKPVGIIPTAPTISQPNNWSACLLFAARFIVQKIIGWGTKRFYRPEHWSLALCRVDHEKVPLQVPLNRFVPVVDDGQRFYADPFLVSSEGRQWLFVEEFDYRAGKGVISCSEVSGRSVGFFQKVLERPYHLSYPVVFQHETNVYMMPETGGNRSLELYRAISFPTEWALTKVLLSDIEVYDATFLRYQERWWIFAAIAHRGGSAQDELAIFYSDRLEGPWEPHAANPVKSDCRSARPAGHFIQNNGRLMRPAQNCERTYGSGLVWLEIVELTPNRFSEKLIAQWNGSDVLNSEGIHTFNSLNDMAVLDFRRGKWRRFGSHSGRRRKSYE